MSGLPMHGAIIHDWFQGMFGSEQVVDVIRRSIFDPGFTPDIFTFAAKDGAIDPALGASIKQTSRLSSIADKLTPSSSADRWRLFAPLAPFYFRGLDLSDYEIVIASSHAFAFHVRPPRDALFVVYCHTPARYIWLPEVDQRFDSRAGATLLSIAGPVFRQVDRRAARRPDVFIANSSNVQTRIRRFFGRHSTVVHPPVDIDSFAPGNRRPGHFTWIHRMVPYKRPELVLEAFRGLPYSLTMIGGGPLEERLRAVAPQNVHVLGHVPRDVLREELARASGFVHVAVEDFGISMVEALASGVPVIGANAGGACDIVRHGIDGVLIDSVDVGSLRRAVAFVAEQTWDQDELRKRSTLFSTASFVERFLEVLDGARLAA